MENDKRAAMPGQATDPKDDDALACNGIRAVGAARQLREGGATGLARRRHMPAPAEKLERLELHAAGVWRRERTGESGARWGARMSLGQSRPAYSSWRRTPHLSLTGNPTKREAEADRWELGQVGLDCPFGIPPKPPVAVPLCRRCLPWTSLDSGRPGHCGDRCLCPSIFISHCLCTHHTCPK